MKGKYIKNFDAWNRVKKQIDKTDKIIFAHPREVWWSSLGTNIGVELDGKNENFERLIIIHIKSSTFLPNYDLQHLKSYLNPL